jgi:hypothetical protein
MHQQGGRIRDWVAFELVKYGPSKPAEVRTAKTEPVMPPSPDPEPAPLLVAAGRACIDCAAPTVMKRCDACLARWRDTPVPAHLGDLP